MSDQLALFLITGVGGLAGGLLSYFIAPWFATWVESRIEDKKERNSIKRQRKIDAVNSIYAWVEEHLTATTLPFSKASEEDKEWRSAVYRYEESDASFSHTLALTRRLGNAKKVESELELLRTETKRMMKTYAWNKLHKLEKDDAQLEAEFDGVKDKAINHASEIYTLLDSEATAILEM